MRMRPALMVLLAIAGGTWAGMAAARDLTIANFVALPRLSQPRIAPGGRQLVYTETRADLEANRVSTSLWLVDTATGAARELDTAGPARAAQWSDDGKAIAFLSARNGRTQVYRIELARGTVTALTHLPVDVESFVWSPDGRSLAVTARLARGCHDLACTAARAQAGPSPRIYDSWPVLGPVDWLAGPSHLFLIRLDGTAPPRDLTPGAGFDVPPHFGSDGAPDPGAVVFAPDSKRLVFASAGARGPSGLAPARLYTVATTGGDPEALSATSDSISDPAISPDGKRVAYRAVRESANPAAFAHLLVQPLAGGAPRDLTADSHLSVGAPTWRPDGQALYFLAEQATAQPLFEVALSGTARPVKLIDGSLQEFALARSGAIAFIASTIAAPPELFLAMPDQSQPRALTQIAATNLADIDLPAAEHFEFRSSDGAKVEAMFVPPPPPRRATRVPLLVLLHGGPHTRWGDSWFLRANAELFAAQGYGVLLVNRRGSSGYGEAFAAGAVGDWCGQPARDILAGIDAALARYPFLDPERIGAAGASYGGYMADWLATHSSRFKVIASHAGIFDLSLQYAMDTPWFVEAEMGGTPWDVPADFAAASPSSSTDALGRLRTPMLLTVGDRDLRVPYLQSVALFNALQRQGVPSRLVVFPGDGHYILKPRNAAAWYEVTIDWLGRYLKLDR